MAKREFRIIVTGGPDFEDYATLQATLLPIVKAYKQLRNEVVLVTGGTVYGADDLAARFAEEHGCKLFPIGAGSGKSSVIPRNHHMVNYAGAARATGGSSMFLACWNGNHFPTKHLLQLATNEGIRINYINYESKPSYVDKAHVGWSDEVEGVVDSMMEMYNA